MYPWDTRYNYTSIYWYDSICGYIRLIPMIVLCTGTVYTRYVSFSRLLCRNTKSSWPCSWQPCCPPLLGPTQSLPTQPCCPPLRRPARAAFTRTLTRTHTPLALYATASNLKTHLTRTLLIRHACLRVRRARSAAHPSSSAALRAAAASGGAVAVASPLLAGGGAGSRRTTTPSSTRRAR